MASMRCGLWWSSLAGNFAAADIGFCPAAPHPLRCIGAIHRWSGTPWLERADQLFGTQEFLIRGQQTHAGLSSWALLLASCSVVLPAHTESSFAAPQPPAAVSAPAYESSQCIRRSPRQRSSAMT